MVSEVERGEVIDDPLTCSPIGMCYLKYNVKTTRKPVTSQLMRGFVLRSVSNKD